MPEVTVIGGGWGPTLEPEKFLEFCDYVCFGEGEKSIEIICNKMKSSKPDFRDVPNMIYASEDGSIVKKSGEFSCFR